MITDADIPKPEQPTIVLETETVRGGGNRDAPGHSLSWLTRATTVYGHLTEGGAWTARPADGGARCRLPLSVGQQGLRQLFQAMAGRKDVYRLLSVQPELRRGIQSACQPHGQFRTD